MMKTRKSQGGRLTGLSTLNEDQLAVVILSVWQVECETGWLFSPTPDWATGQ